MASLQQPIEENETNSEITQVDAVIETTELQNLSIEEVEIDFLAKIKKLLFNVWRNVIGIKSTSQRECNTKSSWKSIISRLARKECIFSQSVTDMWAESKKVFANLIMVSVMDPGIIPKNDESSFPESTENGRIRSKRIVINERNYRLYVLLLVMATIYFVYIFAFSCQKIQQNNDGNGMGLIDLVRDCPETLALACFSFVAALFVGGLTCYHMYLMATNQTGYENFRQLYGGTKNPFNKGVVNNIKEVLFSPWTPSRINFRSEI
ncbi:hypothetical protein RND71_013206 [Anisodus tanguticus]|uniref:S-acyltransferase n=1 Tax=Anisodus tanguticus TaxID=243964 RepID=A0AAE1VQK9_9SOLA|nr:hypothetical protein RND71_013206 [Anisodus tanguticus]